MDTPTLPPPPTDANTASEVSRAAVTRADGLMSELDRAKRERATEFEIECARAAMPSWVKSAAECFRDALRESHSRHGSPFFAGVWFSMGRNYASKLVLLEDVYARCNVVGDAVMRACSEAWRARLEEEREGGRADVLDEQRDARRKHRDRKRTEAVIAHLRSNRK